MMKMRLKKRIAVCMALTMTFSGMTGLCACNRSESGEITPKYPLIAISAIGEENSAEAVMSGAY